MMVRRMGARRMGAEEGGSAAEVAAAAAAAVAEKDEDAAAMDAADADAASEAPSADGRDPRFNLDFFSAAIDGCSALREAECVRSGFSATVILL